jgi:imidazolonepropionase-like amidohydrolase
MVSSSLALRPDYLKIRVDSFLGRNDKMSAEVYRALIAAAAEQELRVVSHMVELEDARSLLEAGTGLLAHSVRDQPVDADFIQLMAASGVCMTPTFMREVSTFVYASRPDFFDDPWFLRYAPEALIEQLLLPETQARYDNESAHWYRGALPVAVANMMAIHRGGGTIAMGTDTGVGQRFQGYFEQLEMEMMQAAGMTAHEVLMSATLDAARCLGKEQLVGSLQPGSWADFLLLTHNPLEDVAALRSLQAVYIGGATSPGPEVFRDSP